MAIAAPVAAPNPTAAPIAADDFIRFAAEVRALLGCDEVLLLSTMPRGGLQVCRRLSIQDGLVRRYHGALHLNDRLAWNALRTGVARPEPADESSETPLAYGYSTVLALRVDSPVFHGYPGVLLALRRRSSTAPVQSEPQSQIDRIRSHFARTLARPTPPERETHPRHFVFDDTGRCVVGEADLARLDSSVVAGLTDLASHALQADTATDSTGRTCVTDSRGVLVPVELNRFDAYPALSQHKIVFVTLHPDIADWSALSEKSFEADAELSRLTRSVAYMVEHFRTGPTLDAIAHSVQLSPFHFHRRFTEVFGVTPKHLLYDLQIDFAKQRLADPNRQLVEIARECGFAHQSHFTSRFKQGAGVTPSRWRRTVLRAPIA